MARPQLLPCDADALIQAFLSNNVKPLQVLHRRFGIQPVVVPEVELELRSNRKFGQRIAPELKKALGTGVLRVLDNTVLENLFPGPSASTSAAATISAIQTLGSQYEVNVDFGEAYTHAAAVTLGVPSLSHDITALRALVNAGARVPDPVLRWFDLMVLALQVGEMSQAECDTVRKTLCALSEWVPLSFQHDSFRGGLSSFCPRILDGNLAPIGAPTAKVGAPFANRLVL